MFSRCRSLLRELYFGADRRAQLFQYGLLAFDLVTISFFVFTTFVEPAAWIDRAEVAIGLLLAAELAARCFAAADPWRQLVLPSSIADVVVIASLLVPWTTENLAFLRILRAVRLIRSYHLLNRMRSTFPFVRHHFAAIRSALDLLVFMFVMSAVVYVAQEGVNPGIRNYLDALYFTVTALTTTGFGDIVPVGVAGRVLTVAIMIVGISLFIRLAQNLFRPPKVEYPCPHCGLSLHDPDAVHCKHCGAVLHIPTEGE